MLALLALQRTKLEITTHCFVYHLHHKYGNKDMDMFVIRYITIMAVIEIRTCTQIYIPSQMKIYVYFRLLGILR